ncbi:Fructokinase [Spironucleus salmonicida]|uniref:Fructokinase n=1 Tax=Spironucleus salmonicida TaxID=348837 RepID=V6LM84_9EUKA|nr:Fructokinase [Spironucleus salmonicida]|eukprot:EST44816.1 Fructokinase [Spironucleus salmonicida]
MPSYHVGLPILDVIFENNVPKDALTGGAVLNSCVSLARVGADSHFVSAFCADPVAKIFKEFFEKNKISTQFMSESQHKSMVALAFKAASTVYEFRGDIPYQDMVQKFPELTEKDIVQFGDYFVFDQDYQIDQIKAKSGKATKYLDPNIRNSVNHQQMKKVIDSADILRMSDEDAESMYPGLSIIQILEKNPHLCGIFNTTEKTATYIGKGVSTSVQCPKITPVSTIGAGDNFNAGVIYGMLKFGLTKANLNQANKSTIEQVLNFGVKFAQNVCMSSVNYVDEDFKPE